MYRLLNTLVEQVLIKYQKFGLVALVAQLLSLRDNLSADRQYFRSPQKYHNFGLVALVLTLLMAYHPLSAQKSSGVIIYTYDLADEQEKAERSASNVRRAAELGYDREAQDMLSSLNPYKVVYEVAFKNNLLLQQTDEDWQKAAGVSATYLERTFYTNLSRKELTTVESNGERKTEKLIALDWEIHDETRKLGGFICQKATTHVEGKTITAWFAREIPIAGGPAGYWGLPGFILELHTGEGYTYFFTDYTSQLPAGASLTPP